MFLWKSWLFSKNERAGDDSGVDSGNDNGVNNGDDKGEWIYVALCRFWYFTSGTLSSFLNFLLPFTDVNLQKGIEKQFSVGISKVQWNQIHIYYIRILCVKKLSQVWQEISFF